MNILYVYTNISPAFIPFINVRPPTTPTFPPLSYQIFSPVALRGEMRNDILRFIILQSQRVSS